MLGRVLWVDLGSRSVEVLQVPEEALSLYVGGRGLGVALLARTISKGAARPEETICFMAGPLTGSGYPMANRLTAVFVSPLTGTVAWANTGGYAGADLRSTGHLGVVVTGSSEDPVYLLVHEGGASIREAGRLWGVDAVTTVGLVRQMEGDVRVLAIGRAGENAVRIATVVNDAGRSSGVRHGLGCVMGRMRLKALAVRGRHPPLVTPSDRAGFREAVRRAATRIRGSMLLNRENGLLAVHGTPLAMRAIAEREALPVKNYSRTRIEAGGLPDHMALESSVLLGRLTCYGCPVTCRRETASLRTFTFRTEGPDYAQLSSLGTNCLLLDVEAISYLTYRCYVLGLDPIEAGNTLAVLAEATELGATDEGLGWGDVGRMEALLEMAARRVGIGALVAEGAERLAKALGTGRIAPSVKGITVQNVDPRAEPAWGLLNATESYGGAAHVWVYGDLVTCFSQLGITTSFSDPEDPHEVAAAVFRSQTLVAVLDSLQVCAFSRYALGPEDYAAALESLAGLRMGPQELLDAGRRILDLERHMNSILGAAKRDSLPPRFTEDPIPEGVHAGRVCELGPMLEEYYRVRGLDSSGLPRSAPALDVLDL